MTSRVGALTIGVALLSAAGCARQGAPTGGQPDRVPPVVVSVEPAPFAEVRPGTDELRVRFNERISEQVAGGRLADVVLVSPEVPELEVSHKRDGLDIRIPGGLKPGVTYTIRVVPQIRDMFGNPMAAPFEWAVSTGGTFSDNAVVGQIWDRATGDFLTDVRVVLTPEHRDGTDTLRWAVVSGDEGLYAMRILPPGGFLLEAFVDRNRNRTLDPTEPRGAARDSLGPADTVFLSLPVLLPDSTPAVLAQGEAVDSVVVRLLFDDMVDPTVPLDGVSVRVSPDTVGPTPAEPLPEVRRLFHERDWSQYRDSLIAAGDSTLARAIRAARSAGDSARADSLAEAGPPPVPGGPRRGPAVRPGGPGGGASALLPDGTPRPSNVLVALLAGPLQDSIPAVFIVEGVVNLNGLEGGGGSISVVWAPAPPDSAAVPDTMVVPDTGVVADTAGVSGDSRLPLPAR